MVTRPHLYLSPILVSVAYSITAPESHPSLLQSWFSTSKTNPTLTIALLWGSACEVDQTNCKLQSNDMTYGTTDAIWFM